MEVSTEILEGALKLTVNREKTHMVKASQGIKFLGGQIHTSWTSIQDKKVDALKEKMKVITRRSSPANLEQVVANLNPIVRGFANYFRMAKCHGVFWEWAAWVRRLRHNPLSDWKKPARLHRRLLRLGHQGDFPKLRMRSWCHA